MHEGVRKIRLKPKALQIMATYDALLQEILVFNVLNLMIYLVALWRVTALFTEQELSILGVSCGAIWVLIICPALHKVCMHKYYKILCVSMVTKPTFISISLILQTILLVDCYVNICKEEYLLATLFSLPMSILVYIFMRICRYVKLYGDSNKYIVWFIVKFLGGHLTKAVAYEFIGVNYDELSDEHLVSLKSGVILNLVGKSKKYAVDLTVNDLYYEQGFVVIKPINGDVAITIPANQYISTEVSYLDGTRTVVMKRKDIYVEQ